MRSERALRLRRSRRAQRFDFGGVGFELLGAALDEAELEAFALARGNDPVIANVLCAVNEDAELAMDGGGGGVSIHTRGEGARITASGLSAELRRVGPARFACSVRVARGASLTWLAGVLAPVVVAAVQTFAAAEQAASARPALR